MPRGIKLDLETLKKRVADETNGEYEFLADEYNGYHTPHKFKHVKCGNVYQNSPNNFLVNGQRCYPCTQKENGARALEARKKPYDLKWAKEMVLERGDGQYVLVTDEYVNVHTDMRFLHLVCHTEYSATLNNFRQGTRCPNCRREQSRGEEMVERVLRKLRVPFEKEVTMEGLRNERPLRIDFWIEDCKVAIEYDGFQHSDKSSRFYTEKAQENDAIKDQFCKDNDILLIRIPHTVRTDIGVERALREELEFND